ncbi:MAG: hypothetical protein D8M59_02925 [Planctomycetes bacterium]|nr:hypothetical protein [Planctomycetota bacterium]NOG52949.1 hypothetical protein [Planctomycetota bacterium]
MYAPRDTQSGFAAIMRKVLIVILPLALLDVLCLPALAKKTTYRFTALPELDGNASRAFGGVSDPDLGYLRVAGEARTASGTWQAAVWRSVDEGRIWEVRGLPGLGYANSVAYNLTIVGSPTGKVVASGAFYDEGQFPAPARWERLPGEDWVGTLLPTLDGGQTGEEIATGTDDSGNVLGVGWSRTNVGVKRAVFWESDDQGGWQITGLPSLSRGAEAQANSVDGADSLLWIVAGFSYDAVDRMQPVIWEFEPGQGWRVGRLPLPSDGVTGQAVDFDGEYLGQEGGEIAGSYEDAEGNTHAISWYYDDATQRWELVDLRELPGYANGQALSVLHPYDQNEWEIVVGSCDNGPGTAVATMWQIDQFGTVSSTDLNASTFGADGWVLEVATNSFSNAWDVIWIPLTVVGNGIRTGLADDPHAFALIEPRLDLFEPVPGIAGVDNTFRIERCTPFERIHIIRGFVDGLVNVPGCPGSQLHIANPAIAGIVVADADGVAELTAFVPPFAHGKRVLMQAVEHGNCDVSNLVDYTFP